MDRASSLIFPGSRTLAGWWRQLSGLQPQALAVGYSFLHRIEAPVHVNRETPIDPLAHFILQALTLEASGAAGLSELQQRLRLPGFALGHLLADMQHAGLLTGTSDRWQMTERGRHALDKRTTPIRVCERRVFPFVERLDAQGQRTGPPRFVSVAECVAAAWQVDDALRFDIGDLQSCIAQTTAWKQASAFPLDVDALADGPELEPWQRVIVDRPERVMLVLALLPGGAGEEARGFAVKVDGWTLHERTPVLAVPANVADCWPELTQAPPLAVWQEAWRSWCKQKQLPGNEVEMCSLAYQPPRLEVQAPARLVQRLQAARSDLFKGEAWLLVGDGYVRTAAQLAMRPLAA